MNIIDQELKCLRCGIKYSDITRYKHNVPICVTCKKKVTIWHRGSRFALVFFIFTCVALGIMSFILYMLSFRDKFWCNSSGCTVNSFYLDILGWFQTALAFAIVFLVCTIVLLVVRRIYGINPKNYLKSENGNILIKSEKDEGWTSYQTWMEDSLDESMIPKQEKLLYIEKETQTQKSIIKSNYKKGVRMLRGGAFLFIFGLVSLIYGLVVTLPAGFPIGTLAFYTVHLPSSLPPIVIGLILMIVGSRKKKT